MQLYGVLANLGSLVYLIVRFRRDKIGAPPNSSDRIRSSPPKSNDTPLDLVSPYTLLVNTH